MSEPEARGPEDQMTRHCLRRHHLVDVRCAVAQLAEDLARVLAVKRSVRLVLACAAGEDIGKLAAPDLALGWMLLFPEEADILEVRIGHQVVDRIVARRRHVELVEQLDPFVGRLVAEAGRLDLEVGAAFLVREAALSKRGSVLSSGRPIASKKAKACALVLGRTVT